MKIILRSVTENDVDLLFTWTNDSVVRANSFHSEPVSYENHVAWFGKKLEDANRLFFIAESAEGQPVGVIRVEPHENEPEVGVISYSVARESRGLGIGTKLLKEIVQKVKETNIHALVGQVKPTNVASRQAFLHAGYLEVQKKDDEIEYRIEVK